MMAINLPVQYTWTYTEKMRVMNLKFKAQRDVATITVDNCVRLAWSNDNLLFYGGRAS